MRKLILICLTISFLYEMNRTNEVFAAAKKIEKSASHLSSSSSSSSYTPFSSKVKSDSSLTHQEKVAQEISKVEAFKNFPTKLVPLISLYVDVPEIIVPDEPTQLMKAIENKKLNEIETLLQIKETNVIGALSTLLVNAHMYSLEEIQKLMKLLFEHNANVNERFKGNTPLLIALTKQKQNIDPTIIKELLDQGANVDAINVYGDYGLYLAVLLWPEALWPKIFHMLLDHKADINAKNGKGNTVLILNTFYKYKPELMRLLIDRGANINAINNDGETALTVATCFHNEHAIGMLLDAGADTNIEDKNGKTFYSIIELDKARPAYQSWKKRVEKEVTEITAGKTSIPAFGKEVAEYL